MPVENLL